MSVNKTHALSKVKSWMIILVQDIILFCYSEFHAAQSNGYSHWYREKNVVLCSRLCHKIKQLGKRTPEKNSASHWMGTHNPDRCFFFGSS